MKGDQSCAFYAQICHDIAAEYKTLCKRWLMAVYSVTEWEPVDVFDMNRFRAINGLVLEKREEDGWRFRRCGTFKISADAGSDNQTTFWKGALRWDVDGVKEKCDCVIFPALQESKLKYVTCLRVSQYFISIV